VKLEPHPLAALFPPMGAEEFKETKASIEANGLRHPITLLDGKILDGWNRYRACDELGIKAETVEFTGPDPLAFVLDENVRRRQLSESQKAMIASRLATLKNGQKKEAASIQAGSMSQADAATAVGVARAQVQYARVVQEKGSAELVRAVEQNRISVSAAKALVALPPKTQAAISLEKDERSRRQLVKEAKRTAAAMPKPEPQPVELALSIQTAKVGGPAYYTIKAWSALSKSERLDLIAEGFESGRSVMNEQKSTAIEWAQFSLNTVNGCLHGCPYCYARDASEKFPYKFEPVFHPARLAAPTNTKFPAEKVAADASFRNVFANSMSDLFGQWVPVEWIDATLRMAARNARWRFLMLTKFPQRAADFEFPDNVWMGTTVDAQARVANAEKAFTKIRCKTKWLSVEPMLEPLQFKNLGLFQWVVIGGASPSAQTPPWVPPFDWVAELQVAAREAGCRIYHKTNLHLPDSIRIREFPWVAPRERALPKPFRYLKGM